MRWVLVNIALFCTLIGCTAAPTDRAAEATSEKVQGTQYHQLGGAVARCTTNDGGFTTICRAL